MAQLFCDNEFCIYQKQGKCVLENVQLDIQGNCTECIYIEVDESTLNSLKERLLRD